MKSIIEKEHLFIKTIPGIKKEDYRDFDTLGLSVEIHEQEPQALASFQEQIIDYIVISTLVFPFDFVKDLVKDTTKQAFIVIIQKAKALWDKQKNYKVYSLKPGEDPDYKQLKIVLSFPIDSDEISTLEIYDNVSEELTEKIITQYFDLLKLQVENRQKEDKEFKKLKIPVKNISRKGLRKPWNR